eukprot:TRINITY_DN77703_c0_g1_i1.p1 TRINITY_DN77703_c0_g1~~TRINITY_DN77703_c0_g1_i1.p1  ORF type:complete len:255 (-),score=13.52 TRINITY_DN77703_c0_g1_i1:41-805(-)
MAFSLPPVRLLLLGLLATPLCFYLILNQGHGVLPFWLQSDKLTQKHHLSEPGTIRVTVGGTDAHLESLKFWATIAFVIFYYYQVVRQYRAVLYPPPAHHRSVKILEDSPLCVCKHVSLPNCFLSFYCHIARNGHTLEKTQAVSSYWWGALASAMCLPCTLCWFQNSVRQALGAGKMDPCASCFYALCCPWCLVAQQAEALDAASGQRLEGFLRVGQDPWAGRGSEGADDEEGAPLTSPARQCMAYGQSDKSIDV